MRALTREQRVRAEEALAGDLRDAYMVLPVSGRVLRSAGTMTSLYSLRAYDAVQLASALVLRDEIDALQEADVHDPESVVDQVLMLSYDRDLHAAAVAIAALLVCILYQRWYGLRYPECAPRATHAGLPRGRRTEPDAERPASPSAGVLKVRNVVCR